MRIEAGEYAHMTFIPNMREAHEILARYSTSAPRLRHAEIVSAGMGHFAEKHDSDNALLWRVTGLLHDLDIELYPEEHCLRQQEMMRELGLDPRIIRAAASHGYGNKVKDIAPEHVMEKVLYTLNELCVLMDAVAQALPSRRCADLTVDLVKEKMASADFLPTCPRPVIQRGFAMLGWEPDYVIGETIQAMKDF